MSTARTMSPAAQLAQAPLASGSVALVPIPRKRPPVMDAADAQRAVRMLFGLGYTALAAIWVANVLEPWMGWTVIALYIPAGLSIGVAGLGIAGYTLWKPRERKFRQALAAAAALVLTIASVPPRLEMGREAYASSRVAALQPAADELLRSGRIDLLRIGNGAQVNEYPGSEHGIYWTEGNAAATITLDDVLRAEGIDRAEYNRVTAAMRRAGVKEVRVGTGHLVFRMESTPIYILYARPGQSPRPPADLVPGALEDHSTPLGGGWYLLREPIRF